MSGDERVHKLERSRRKLDTARRMGCVTRFEVLSWDILEIFVAWTVSSRSSQTSCGCDARLYMYLSGLPTKARTQCITCQ
jgi:hypothetical protein